jgi:hypothetical protein
VIRRALEALGRGLLRLAWWIFLAWGALGLVGFAALLYWTWLDLQRGYPQ